MKITQQLLLLICMLISSALAMEGNNELTEVLNQEEQEKIRLWLLLSGKIKPDDLIVKIKSSSLSHCLPKKVLAIFSNNDEEKYHYDIINCLNQLPVYTISVASHEDPDPRSCCVMDVRSFETIVQKQNPTCLNISNKE